MTSMYEIEITILCLIREVINQKYNMITNVCHISPYIKGTVIFIVKLSTKKSSNGRANLHILG